MIHHPSGISHHSSSISHHPSAILHYPPSISHHPSPIIHDHPPSRRRRRRRRRCPCRRRLSTIYPSSKPGTWSHTRTSSKRVSVKTCWWTWNFHEFPLALQDVANNREWKSKATRGVFVVTLILESDKDPTVVVALLTTFPPSRRTPLLSVCFRCETF